MLNERNNSGFLKKIQSEYSVFSYDLQKASCGKTKQTKPTNIKMEKEIKGQIWCRFKRSSAWTYEVHGSKSKYIIVYLLGYGYWLWEKNCFWKEFSSIIKWFYKPRFLFCSVFFFLMILATIKFCFLFCFVLFTCLFCLFVFRVLE